LIILPKKSGYPRLKATKTSLYKLIANYETLPIMKKTTFKKAYRSPSFWLEWYHGDHWCKAFFAACMGSALLAVEKREDCGDGRSREVHRPAVAELRKLGMIEDHPPKRYRQPLCS